MRRIAYIAVDDGPCETVRSLSTLVPGKYLPGGYTASEEWRDTLASERIELLICGTSDSAAGAQVEDAARAAAAGLRIPCVVVEDFPGNYRNVAGGRPALLVVESELAARLAGSRAPTDSLQIHVCPAVRYDPLRRRLEQLRRSADAGSSNHVLWIGQPETQDSIETLKSLIPSLKAERATLLFRAHPRDTGHNSGAYTRILHGSSLIVEDVTASALDDCLKRRPRVLATQFSSVAVQGGFWGIPALNILLWNAGAARLAGKKGYAIPPWCEAGAAFLVTEQAEMAATLERALYSNGARARTQESFDRYFMVHEESAPRLVNLLYNQGFL